MKKQKKSDRRVYYTEFTIFSYTFIQKKKFYYINFKVYLL